jgi:signal transduction histidine kinase
VAARRDWAAGAAGAGARANRPVTVAWLVVCAAAVPTAVLTIVLWSRLAGGDSTANLGGAIAGPVYATLGALIVRRARNLVGWSLLAQGAGLVFLSLASAWAVYGLDYPGTLPAPAVAGLLAECSFVPQALGVAILLLLFPTGSLPSRRWRPVVQAVAVATVLLLAAFVVRPRQLLLPAPGGFSASAPNPAGIAAFGHGPVAVAGNTNGLSVVFALAMVAAVASLVVRYRAGTRTVRQQIKWLFLVAALVAASQVVALISMASGHGLGSVPTAAAYAVLTAAILLGVPAAVTLAILWHGLYQIDMIISRAVQYGLLSAVLTGVYVAIVIGIGTLAGYSGGGSGLSVAAAVAVALLFQPVRQRAQRIANRLVYGERASPYQVLADFAEDMAGQLDPGLALDRMAAVLAGATGAVRVAVWVRVGGELRPQVTWPREEGNGAEEPVLLAGNGGAGANGGAGRNGPAEGLPDMGPVSRAVAVRHSGELLGALTVVKPASEPVSADEDKLLTQLASQAGLVLRNARLTAELRATIDDLRASRRRLVQAQDAERQRIERNLHDGAQQQLVALRIQLSLLDTVAGDPDEVREIGGQLRAGLAAALDDLRALARGIYPPLLAEQGLGAALRSQASRAALPVEVTADGVGRYPRETEAAAYFCILEALQNTAKYAGARAASVSLAGSGGRLEFTVADDGAGFDVAAAVSGTGLQGMKDRLAAVGGTLRIESAPGKGTAITGQLPAAELVSA